MFYIFSFSQRIMNIKLKTCTEFLIKDLDIFISTHENKRMDKFQVPAYFIGRRPSKVTKDHEVGSESYYLPKGCVINYDLLLLHKTYQSITREASLEVKHEPNKDPLTQCLSCWTDRHHLASSRLVTKEIH